MGPSAEAFFSEASRTLHELCVKNEGCGQKCVDAALQAAAAIRAEALMVSFPKLATIREMWKYPWEYVHSTPSLGMYVKAMEHACNKWVEAAPTVSKMRCALREAPIHLREPAVQLEAANVNHPARRLATTRALRSIMTALHKAVAMLDEWESVAIYATDRLPSLKRCCKEGHHHFVFH